MLTRATVGIIMLNTSFHRNPIVWITVANVVYLASYTVRDILRLRLLTVLAASLLIPYHAMQSVP